MTVDNWQLLDCKHSDCTQKFGRAMQLREHQMRVHGEVTRPSHDTIIEAVKCPVWQELRLMLKGLPTQRKLHHLEQYLKYGNSSECCNTETRFVQTVNYLNALARGGMIEPLNNEERCELELHRFVMVRIKR